MNLVFCLYKYFPYGGLQRDFIRIARECQRRGHSVRVYVLSWDGEVPPDLKVTVVPVTAIFNHNRYRKFSDWMERELERSPTDCVVGFNKMPGLHVYYAADSCFEEKARAQRGAHYRLLPRYKHFASYERAVFGAQSDTEILMISETQKPFFIDYYHTQAARMHLLPPGISRDRVAPPDAEAQRASMRKELGLTDDMKLILLIGSGFIRKGLNRAILAVDSLPPGLKARTRFIVIGEDKQERYLRVIKRLQLEQTVSLIGGSNDIPRYLLAGDLLLHPAFDENAGMVLLEAIVAGLPVLATDVCGYGHYILEADMGRLIPTPFRQEDLNTGLRELLETDNRQKWVTNGKAFAETADIFSLPQRAVDVIESVMHQCAKDLARRTSA